jgi:hypothetical protein
MAFDPSADFSDRFQLQLTKEQRRKLAEVSDWSGESASALLRHIIEERWDELAPSHGVDVSKRVGAQVRRPPGNLGGPRPGISAAGRPHQMDAPDGPVCGCGLPSTHESGWCGQCDVTDSVVVRTGT